VEEKIKEKKLKIRREVFLKKDLSYPHASSKKEKDIKYFDNLLPKNYFARNMKQDSNT